MNKGKSVWVVRICRQYEYWRRAPIVHEGSSKKECETWLRHHLRYGEHGYVDHLQKLATGSSRNWRELNGLFK